MKFKTYASSSAGNMSTVRSGSECIMIDCGVPWKSAQKMLNFQTHKVAAVLLSHQHADHSRSVRDAAKAGIDIFLLPETRKALGVNGHRYHEVTPKEQFTVGRFTILPFNLVHDVPSCGFLIESNGEKAVYITDSHYCPYRFKGLNIIAIEANYSKKTFAPDLDPAVKKRLYSTHFSLERVVEFLDANDLSSVREIHLIHLSDGNSDERYFKREVEKATGIPVFVAGK